MASRTSGFSEEDVTEHDDGFDSLGIDRNTKPEKIVIADLESLIYWTLYEKNPDGTRKELTEEDLPFLEGKLNEMIIKILSKIENYFIIKKLYIFVKGDTNFRHSLYPEYKSNRKERHPLTNNLYSWMQEVWNTQKSLNCESEDMVYSMNLALGGENTLILFCDHDLLEIENTPLYNYQKDKFFLQTPLQARWERISKLILGEAGDGCNLSKGLGKKHLLSNYKIDMTEEELENQLVKSYTKVWKTEELAKEKLALAKELLLLKNIN